MHGRSTNRERGRAVRRADEPAPGPSAAAVASGLPVLATAVALGVAAPAPAAHAAVGGPGGAGGMSPMAWVAAGMAVLILALGGLIVVLVLRYERRLAEAMLEVERQNDRRIEARLQSRSAVILGLAKLAESRDDETGRHLERVRAYVRLIAEALEPRVEEIDRDFIETVVETSSLHDIGKVGIPDAVLLKPGRLNDEERERVQRHTTIGGDTLLALKRKWGEDPFLVTACEIAFAHHEWYDGSGYPFGLAGDLIPLSARIVAVADVYDALTCERVYKRAMSHAEARDAILDRRGAQFDPMVVDAFLEQEDAIRGVLELELSGEGGDALPDIA